MPLVTAVAEGDRVGAGAADEGLDVADGAGVGERAEGELVAAARRGRPTWRWSARCPG